jgi:hypothetical protein
MTKREALEKLEQAYEEGKRDGRKEAFASLKELLGIEDLDLRVAALETALDFQRSS